MARVVRSVSIVIALVANAATHVLAQSSPLVFTVATPERVSAESEIHPSVFIEERGLALWTGASSDFGLGVDATQDRWTIRAMTSMTPRLAGNDRVWAFQQVEFLRPLSGASASTSIAVGGGIRQEWGGRRVWIGRALAGSAMAGGRLQGGIILERADSSRLKRDAVDVMTTVGWSRRLSNRIALGIEGVGQDLEGFWDSAEAEGGARLIVGPSLRVQSKHGNWTAAATAGPVLRSASEVGREVVGRSSSAGGRRFGIFASASWLPALR